MLPLITVVKFYSNPKSNTNNSVITRTLLKIGIIDSAWLKEVPEEKHPKQGELWKVKIIKEVEPGKPHGCFLLHPIEKVDQVNPLIYGMYDEEEVNGIILVHPHSFGSEDTENINWMLPVKTKHAIKEQNKYAAIVCLV